eukprot:Plantae.Rhodophyta-Purpureofilum_apyrenoidigerum.ctg3506.p2 GENE.Plantae.Rhodophyta-Purpureofilum_apyrenoidigerum.ctg3506~~Plantae.Rhodophyta-Purpureofilum_apyrenoidigerum.ctg3506.p2  ORF type:complete len:202 (+),score=47.63 Plantae.Rhodophyta-Purpureofilum_apyrenoidigerum.ctg3506:151-756(+)
MRRSKQQSHLLEFYGIDCDHCVDMEPLIQKLREEENMPIRRFEVWFNDDNLRLLQRLDVGSACGGVPYFYNKQTRGWICGATTYQNFRNWALGYEYDRFLPPPKEDEKKDGKKPQTPGVAGIIDSVKNFFEKVKSEGLERIQKRTEEKEKETDDAPENRKKNTLIQRGAFVRPARLPNTMSRPGRGASTLHGRGEFPFCLY